MSNSLTQLQKTTTTYHTSAPHYGTTWAALDIFDTIFDTTHYKPHPFTKLQRSDITHYCNKPPRNTATHHCNTPLQHTTTTHHCNTRAIVRSLVRSLLDQTPTVAGLFSVAWCSCVLQKCVDVCCRSVLNTLLQHTTATHYCNTLLQHTTATHYCDTLLQHTTATH